MSTCRRTQTTAGHVLWLAGMLVVLGGLFAMHGLDSHGVAGMSAHAHSVAGSAGTAASTVGHDGMSVVRDEVQPEMSAAADTLAAHASMDAGTAGACMAILGIALLLLLRVPGRDRLRPALCGYDGPARAPSPAGRYPDPPSLVRLSIHRC